MKAEALTQFPVMWLVGLGLVCFMMVFGFMTYWALRPKNKALFNHVQRFPLE